MFAPDGNISGGCKVELDYAVKHGIPVFVLTDAVTAFHMIHNYGENK